MKKIKILYIGFWQNHCLESDFIYLNALKDSNYDITKSDNITENDFINNDIIICGSFLQNPNHVLLVTKYLDKIIYNITEPVDLNNRLMYKLYSKNFFNLTIGYVSEKQNNIKYPHYLNITPEKITQTNNYVQNITYDEVINKKFCCLIDEHDIGKTITDIYNRLKIIEHIDCPSNLFNNFPNELFKKIGRTEYLKNYLFTICPENFVTKFSGYVTDKLFNIVDAGTIPIYYGDLDDIDKQIFNINRIIYFDPTSNISIIKAVVQISKLLSDKNKLYEFFKQPIFCDSALSTYSKIIENLKIRVNNYINKKDYNQSLLTDINIVPPIDHNVKINGIDHIAWINLDRSQDRRLHMENILSKLRVPNTRIQAVDGKITDLSTIKLLEAQMTNYEKACTLSHIKSISHFKNIKGKYFMVLEDDVSFNNLKFFDFDLKTIIKNAPKFDLLLLEKKYNQNLSSLYTKWNSSMYSTACYIISRNGIEKILKKATFENSNFCVYKPLNVADNYLYNGLDTYVYKYNFVSTLDETSLIHPNHLGIHKHSSLIHYISMLNDLVFNK